MYFRMKGLNQAGADVCHRFAGGAPMQRTAIFLVVVLMSSAFIMPTLAFLPPSHNLDSRPLRGAPAFRNSISKQNTQDFATYVRDTVPAWLKEQKSLPFECTACGKCCQRDGDVYMNRSEFTAVAAFLNMSEDAFIRTYSQHVLMDEKEQVAWVHFSSKGLGHCVFLEPDTRHCRIHPVKPVQCRTYPFYPSLLKSPEAWAAECRRSDDDFESSLPVGSTTASGCEGMKPIDDPTANVMEGVPIETVLENLFDYEKHDREMYGDKFVPEW